MAKASLTKVTKEWVEGKNKDLKKRKSKDLKKSKNKKIKAVKYKEIPEKIITTIHLSSEARKLLIYNRADTGETMSEAIERLVRENLRTLKYD